MFVSKKITSICRPYFYFLTIFVRRKNHIDVNLDKSVWTLVEFWSSNFKTFKNSRAHFDFLALFWLLFMFFSALGNFNARIHLVFKTNGLLFYRFLFNIFSINFHLENAFCSLEHHLKGHCTFQMQTKKKNRTKTCLLLSLSILSIQKTVEILRRCHAQIYMLKNPCLESIFTGGNHNSIVT